MRINIFLNINPGPYGGGNQFLKALRDYFKSQNVWSENPDEADVILFNSHHQIKELIKLKRTYPNKLFIHRIDGPVYLIRKDTLFLDKLIYRFNNRLADASIFQSDWSKHHNRMLGLKPNAFETTIINAPDPDIFNAKDKPAFDNNRKVKIIATSWATNKSKGFETYKYLDESLDFSKYEMTFCGNSPLQFKNIQHIQSVPSTELAGILKANDIYITASENDPCSNSLIEALHCGLPAIAVNNGGHPEIIKNAGLIYNDKTQIHDCLTNIANNYKEFHDNIRLPLLNEIGVRYLTFIASVYNNKKKGMESKKMTGMKALNLYISIFIQKAAHRIYGFFHR
jgi:glycosyltransferase involved in cell wall biosynthesis